MFSKSPWAVCALDVEGHDAFKKLVKKGSDAIHPLKIYEEINEGGGSGVGFTTFSLPFNDQEGNSLEDCELAEGVYGVWMVAMEETPLRDPRVLQEHLSYSSYGTPFKFLPKEQKQDIQDMMSKEERTISMVHVPVILDFKLGRLWASTTSKAQLENLRTALSHLEVPTSTAVLDFGINDWPRQLLEKVAMGEVFLDEFQARAEEVKTTGDPKAVEAHPDAVIDRIIKKFYRCMEFDGYHIFLGTPSKLSLTNQTSSVTANTPWDCCEILNQGLGVAQGRITVSERGKENFQDVFSIDVSDTTHIEPGFVLFKGLESHELSKSLKETGVANGRLTIKDYWLCDYESTLAVVGRYITMVKEMLEIEEDCGIKAVSQD